MVADSVVDEKLHRLLGDGGVTVLLCTPNRSSKTTDRRMFSDFDQSYALPMPPTDVVIASGAVDRATGLAIVLGVIIGVLTLCMLAEAAAEWAAKFYARLWSNHKAAIFAWGATATTVLVIALVVWSPNLAIIGVAAWLPLGMLWYQADSHAAFEPNRLKGMPEPPGMAERRRQLENYKPYDYTQATAAYENALNASKKSADDIMREGRLGIYQDYPPAGPPEREDG